MALQIGKFLCKLQTEAIRISTGLTTSFNFFSRSYSRCGKEPCKPVNPCPKKKEKDQCEDFKKKDRCGSKRGKALPIAPCNEKKTSQSKRPCISVTPAGNVRSPTCGTTPCCPVPPCPEFGGKPLCNTAVDGKVAVITGGSSGIGYNIAIAILKNGGKVMLGDKQPESGKEAICKLVDMFGENKAAFLKCDVSSARDMKLKAEMAGMESRFVPGSRGGIQTDRYCR